MEEDALLDGANHVGLHLGGQVVVDDAEAAEELQGDEESALARLSRSPARSSSRGKGQERTAMVMAMSVSVTVSMGDERKGVLRTVFLVTRDSSETALAGKSMWPGRTRKSL